MVHYGWYLLQMLLNLHKKSWIDGLKLDEYQTHCCGNETTIKDMLELAKNYNKVNYLHFCIILMASILGSLMHATKLR